MNDNKDHYGKNKESSKIEHDATLQGLGENLQWDQHEKKQRTDDMCTTTATATVLWEPWSDNVVGCPSSRSQGTLPELSARKVTKPHRCLLGTSLEGVVDLPHLCTDRSLSLSNAQALQRTALVLYQPVLARKEVPAVPTK
jgi:hypothetical protein